MTNEQLTATMPDEDICPDCNGTGKRLYLGDQCQCCHGHGRFSLASAAFDEHQRSRAEWWQSQPLIWRMGQWLRWKLDDALRVVGLQRI